MPLKHLNRRFSAGRQCLVLCCFAVAAIINSSAFAQTCQCLPQTAAQEALKNASLVVLGDVLEKTRFSLPEIGPNYKEFKLKVRVRQYWKGEPERLITVRTPDGDAECGMNLDTGRRYLIYAVGGTMPLVTKCSRTVPADAVQARVDMDEHLGKGRTPPEED